MFASLIGDKQKAGYYAYRIWADYSTGGSDRRRLGEPLVDGVPNHADNQVLILEEFCDWDGQRGGLIAAAVKSGFLVVSESGDTADLVCKDFYPMNNQSKVSIQKKGGWKAAINNYRKQADVLSGDQLKIFDATGHGVSEMEVTDQNKKDAVTMVMIVVRIMKLDELASNDWTVELMETACQIVLRYTNVEREKTFMWLLANRDEPGIPLRVDLILKRFNEYAEKARTEL